MCGICGHINFKSRDKDSRQMLERMNEALKSRGPDEQGIFEDNTSCLAMRRLAIVDVSSGKQPQFNEDKSITVVFNGEIYNHQELRAELLSKKHVFCSKSDTEVIVHGYEEWGEDVFDKLNGMFAIAIYDKNKSSITLARDPSGQKPLYWHYSTDKGLVFSSQLDSLLEVPWIGREINPAAVHHYLSLQYVPDPFSIVSGVNKLRAGEKLIFRLGDSAPSRSSWWRLEFEPKWALSKKQLISEGDRILRASVERALVSERELGIFLSGGIDSSLIAYYAAQILGGELSTYSIDFGEEKFSEKKYAELMAKQISSKHKTFTYRAENLKQAVSKCCLAFYEPCADPAALPLYELSRLASEEIVVALTGDGGDETTAGYKRYLLDSYLEPYALLPKFFTQGIMKNIFALLPNDSSRPEDANYILGLKRLSQFVATSSKASLMRWGSYFSENEKKNLYRRDFLGRVKDLSSVELLAGYYDSFRNSSSLDRSLGADFLTYLPGDLLPKTDRMSMAHSLEARAPFLDKEWIEWSALLPEKFKASNFKTKRILRLIAQKHLPEEIYKRPKRGFNVPISAWIRGELRDWAREVILDNKQLKEIFIRSELEKTLEDHFQSKADYGKRLWCLLVLGLCLEEISKRSASLGEKNS